MTTPTDPRGELRKRINAALVSADDGTRAGEVFLGLAGDLETLAQPIRHALMASPLAWTGPERADAQWLCRAFDDLSIVGYRLALAGAARLRAGDRDARDVLATALFYMGETAKWDVYVAPGAPHDMRKLHALMLLATEHGRERETMALPIESRFRDCTVEALYWRVLLLARFASGTLNGKQMEILDAWLWLWMPVLCGVQAAPGGTALRADLDSALGLQQGPRQGAGRSLYLPREPIEAAYHQVVAEFHAGRMVPAEGLASEFRLEEHVAVLDLVRRNLRQARREPVPRASRRPVGRCVEVFVGLAEIMKRGFAPSAPPTPLGLAPLDDKRAAGARIERDYDTAVASIYDPERRTVRLLDESDTGLGLEGAGGDLEGVAAGDLVAVRLEPDEPLIFGKVVRSVASRTPGHTIIGVRRLAGAARPVQVRRETPGPGADATLVYVAGADSSGRQDAMLVAEREFIDRAPLDVETPGVQFRLRLNRARERGRGWVLAGFEVASARPAWDIEIA